jgi:hypothetical protein
MDIGHSRQLVMLRIEIEGSPSRPDSVNTYGGISTEIVAKGRRLALPGQFTFLLSGKKCRWRWFPRFVIRGN